MIVKKFASSSASVLGIHHCLATVHVSAVDTLTRQIRVARAVRRGLSPHVCGSRPTHLVDGCPMCASHAGQAALRHLMGASGG